jgi:pimeloyl-ACP methyl ester carboxylesterase
MIYLHEYAYTVGFSRAHRIIDRLVHEGWAVYAFDQIGCGTRIEEGRLFYERFPHWSKLGRMVADARWAVDELGSLDFVDSGRIYVLGYSLGATVGLYSAALDNRIAGVVSVCGFTPMRLDQPGKTAEGIYRYSHLHGLLPRLGFFIGSESRIPCDFHEILAGIAPRPLLLVAPTWDQYASLPDVTRCVQEAAKVYELYGSAHSLTLLTPQDYNRFSAEVQERLLSWLRKQLR